MLKDLPQRTKLSKEERERIEPALRVELLKVQYELRDADFSVVLVIAGTDRDGANEVVHLIYDWLDARHVDMSPLRRPSDEERERPPFWRFWHGLPAKGRIGVFPNAWPAVALLMRLAGRWKRRRFEGELRRIVEFERLLVDDGSLVLKIWLHLDDAEQRKQRKRLRSGPDANWFLDERIPALLQKLERDDALEDEVLEGTDHAHARWNVIRSVDPHYRDVAVMRLLRDSIAERLARRAGAEPAIPSPASSAVPDRIGGLDLTAKLDDSEYDRRLEKLQGRLNQAARRCYAHGIPSVLVFEGSDAAGKGGAIRRIIRAIRAPVFEVVPVAAPSDEEKARHYLWRFWRRLPRAGCITIFDRSWYGRVLVERVEGFAKEAQWRRAYDEIDGFEAQLAEHGTAIVKFWLEVDEHVQLERFEARRVVPFKKYKLTPEDFRNRAKRPQYRDAANEMFLRTDRPEAPWHLIAANCKKHARIAVLEAVCEGLERALEARS